jgi:tetratricopeptide (TPR) repeat protein
VRIGHCHSQRGDHAAAAAAYRRALALDPGLSIARRALGQALIQLEDYVGAQTELERVAALVPQDGPTQAALARVYAQRGDEARALDAANRARGQRDALTLPDPIRFQVAQQGRSSRLALERLPGRIAEGDYAGAVDDLKLVLRTRARDPKVHEQLADAYQHLGQKGLADQELAEAKRLHASP